MLYGIGEILVCTKFTFLLQNLSSPVKFWHASPGWNVGPWSMCCQSFNPYSKLTPQLLWSYEILKQQIILLSCGLHLSLFFSPFFPKCDKNTKHFKLSILLGEAKGEIWQPFQVLKSCHVEDEGKLFPKKYTATKRILNLRKLILVGCQEKGDSL